MAQIKKNNFDLIPRLSSKLQKLHATQHSYIKHSQSRSRLIQLSLIASTFSFDHFSNTSVFLVLPLVHSVSDMTHLSRLFSHMWTGIPQSVQRLATGWTVRGSNPGGGEIFRTRPDRPWGPPSLLYNRYRVSFLGIKRPGRGVNYPPTSSIEVKERLELYLYSPSEP
jgi:hypothetical protein